GRLDRVPVAPDPLVAEAREALLRYAAPTLDRLPARLAGTRGPGAAGHAVDVGRLMAAWNAARSARAGEGWTEVDAVDRWARAAGSTFRDACSTVERVGMVRYAVANGHPIPPAPTGYRRLPDGRWVWGAVSEPAPRPSPTGER